MEHASGRRARWRLASRVLAALAIVLLFLWALTFWRPLGLAVWRVGVLGTNGRVCLIWASAAFRVEPGSSMTGLTFSGSRVYISGQGALVWWKPTPVVRCTGSIGTTSFAFVTFWIPPWWLPAPPTLFALFAWWRARRPIPPGHCPRCGYDLAGLALGTTCPECGPAAAPGTSSTANTPATLGASEARP